LGFLAIVLFYFADAFCSPFLISDSQDNVGWYEILGLGVDGDHLTPATSGDQGYLRHDLAGSEVDTTYNINVKACNVWGCSNSVPFSFTPENPPSSAAGLVIAP
jgi:hypothetical protein